MKETINKRKRQPMDWDKIFVDRQGLNFQNIQTAHAT